MAFVRRVEEPVHIVASEEEKERLLLGAARKEVAGSTVRLVPDVTRAALANLRFGQLPAVTGCDSKLYGFLQPGSQEWNEYFSTRKIVDRPKAKGPGGILSVSSNLWDVTGVDEVVSQPLVDRSEPLRQRRYELVQVLTDPYLRDKFQFSEEVQSMLRVMAVGQPDAAAARAQTLIRQLPGLENCLVSAGKYSRSKSWARSSVRAHAARFPFLLASSDASLTGEKLLIYGPESRGKRWFVSGPVWCGGEVADVFRMVCSAGTSSVMFALGSELTILDIDISDGYTFESPSVEYHAGSQDYLPAQSALDSTALMSVHGKATIESYVESLELVEMDGEAVATAVRITPKYVLVNDHVVGSAGILTVGGKKAEPLRTVGKDLWLVKCCADFQSSWVIRDPTPGEAVVVCYRNGAKAQYTSPMTVRTTDGVTLVMSKSTSLTPGMSGGAIISLRDMAFLGVYEGVGAQLAMASAFTQEHFTDVCTAEHASSVGHSEAGDGDGTLYSRMKARGLGKMLDVAIQSLEPLFVGREHVGMGFQSGRILRTTCDPSVLPLGVGKDCFSAVFDPGEKGTFVAKMQNEKDGPMLMRRPSYSERVFVIGYDSEGPYYSNVASRVVHIGVSAKSFSIDAVDVVGALPLLGGLVVAESDGAVLGQYVRHQVSPVFGQVGHCISLHDVSRGDSVSPESVATLLGRLFPMLHVGTWSDQMLEEIFTHSSVQAYKDGRDFNQGNLPLAYIGDAAMKLAFGMEARGAGLAHSAWQLGVQRNHSNRNLISMCESMGLDRYIITGGGTSIPAGSKVKADTFEALVGAVYLSETFDVFVSFCRACQFVPNARFDSEPLSPG